MGQLIADRYELGEFINEGGMGAVYRGRDTQTDQVVALKLLRREIVAKDPTMLHRFAQEGDLLRALNHPNIVKLLAAFTEGDQPYIVMEYVGGGSLADILADPSPLPVSRILAIALELSDALARAHHLKIIHRDIKPANVLLADDGTPRLSDFGVSRSADSHDTASGVVIGTYAYMAPEVFRDSQLDARLDIWAFGVMLFEMLTKQRPFTGGQPAVVITAILNNPVPDLEALRPDAPVALVDLINRMMEKDRDQRISSTRLVGAELEAILRGEVTPAARSVGKASSADDGAPTMVMLQTPDAGRKLNNLPAQTTEFVGREEELAELAELLTGTRLVTILGPGGMGKTRLALEAAAHQLEMFRDGIFFASLAPLSTPETIVPAIGEALRISFSGDDDPKQQLLSYLHSKQLLLVLDNFEHLLAGAPLVSEILESAAGVRILATSRSRLGLQEETLFRLEGMAFPEWKTPDDGLEYSAVKLFLQSARRVQPSFTLKADDLTYLAGICRQVQGMPLGILLAAAWVDSLSLAEISAEISHSLDFLETDLQNVPARQRSIHAVFDYSWNLLSGDERAVFPRLSVFRGGFMREAAQSVAGATLRTLGALVNKSMLRRNADSGRYEIHELLRQYAAESLSDVDRETVARQHFAYFLSLAQQSDPHLFYGGPDKIAWLKRLKTDYNNLQAVLAWSLDSPDPLLSLQLAAALRWYWLSNHEYREGWQWLGRTLAKNPTGPLLLRAKVLHAAGSIANHYPGDFRKSIALCEEALMLACDANDKTMIGWTLSALGLQVPVILGAGSGIALSEAAEALFREMGDKAGLIDALIAQSTELTGLGNDGEALTRLEEALILTREMDEPTTMAWTLYFMADATWRQGDLTRTENLCREGIHLFQELNDLGGQAWFAIKLGDLARRQGDYQQAERYYLTAIALCQQTGSSSDIVQAMTHLGLLEIVRQRPAQAATLLGAAANDPYRDSDNRNFLGELAAARAALGNAAFDAAYAKGQRMSLEQAVAYAIEQFSSEM